MYRSFSRNVLILLALLALLLGACNANPEPAQPEESTTEESASDEPSEAPAEEEEAVEEPVEEEAAEEEPAEEEAASEDAITLRVMVVDYVQDVTDTWLEEEVVPAFQEEHPNVNVEFIYVNWGTLDETVQGYFAAGEGADILNLGSEYVAVYGDRLAPLNEYLGESAWPDITQFAPGTLDTVTWEGELRGLPWLTAPRAYMCDTDKVDNPATFAEAIEAAREATVIDDGAVQQAGIVTTGRLDDWQEYVALIWTLGGSLYDEDGTPTFDSPEARAALEFMYDRRRAVYPDETTADLPEATGSRLADGTAACLWANMWGAPPADDPMWEHISLSATPTHPDFPDGQPVIQVFNDWLAVADYSPNVEMAAEFLKFLGSADNLYTYNEGFGSFPPRQDAWRGYVTDSKLMQDLSSLMNEYGVGFADIREAPRLREILQAEMPAYFTDLQDLDTTLASIQEQYTRALGDAGRIQEPINQTG